MTIDDLGMELEALTDEASAHETLGMTSEAMAATLRAEIRRVTGLPVDPIPKGTPARRQWALTPDGLARQLNKLTTRALTLKKDRLSVDAVADALREEIERMCQPIEL